MFEYFRKVGFQIFEFVKNLSTARKIAVSFTMVGVFAAISLLFYWASDKAYRPLMTNLNPEDSSSIIRILRDKKIPFTVDNGGKTISIPPESVYDLRLELATMGLPQSSVVGYEVFDKQSIGTTSFVQNVNNKRALEGELMRTIGTMKGVKRARVHLALPKKSTFVEDQKKPTASVVLELEPGVTLDEKQVFGIGTLIASAIEGLEVADVNIVDARGKLLSKTSRDPIIAVTANQLEFRQKLEEDLEKRVEDMMSKIVGEGKVVARISADVDFSQVNETQTTYDQDGAAVLASQKDTQSMQGTRPGPYGLAGASSNTPGDPPATNNEVKSDTKKIRETTNFKVPQTVKRTQHSVGSIKQLSVAVVIDGKQVRTPASEGVAAQSKIEPWSAEKLKEFEQIVSKAVGLDSKRGDTLEIKNMEFNREDFDQAEKILAETQRKSYLQNLITYSVISLIIIMFFLFVVRPFIKWITENTIDSVESFLPQTIEELERLQKNNNLPGLEDAMPVLPEKIDPEKVEGEMLKEKIITLIDSNPHKASLVLREWVRNNKKDDVAGGDASKGKSA